jgi:hypothetical protein
LKFECLKNEFEKKFKKKERNPFPSLSLFSLSPLAQHFFRPASIPGQRPFSFSPRARRRPKLAQLRSLAGPARLPPFSFAGGR